MLNNSPNLSFIRFAHVSNAGLRSIATSHCAKSLQTIEAQVNDNAIEEIQSLCRACPNMMSLKLRPVRVDLDGDLISQSLAQYCPLIEVMSTGRWTLTDTGLTALACMHNLKELSLKLHGCTSAAVQRVLQSNPQLTSIILEGDYIDDALVRCMGRCCGNLRSIRLSKRSSPANSINALQDVFRGCPLLESFHLQQPGGILNAVLRALFENRHNLTTLSLSTGGSMPDVQQLDEPILYAYYPTLTKLYVRYGGVLAGALRDIFTYCTNLREVGLFYCIEVSDELVDLLAHTCRNLVSLYLCACTSVTINGILSVVTSCSSLTSLSLQEMYVNDEALILLSRNCPGLTSMRLDNCYGYPVTATTILAVAKACKNLSKITIRGNIQTQRFDTTFLEQAKLLYPHIKIMLIRNTR